MLTDLYSVGSTIISISELYSDLCSVLLDMLCIALKCNAYMDVYSVEFVYLPVSSQMQCLYVYILAFDGLHLVSWQETSRFD
jgi:hypothetical protein